MLKKTAQNTGPNHFPNKGFLLEKVPPAILKIIQKKVANIENNFSGHQSISERLAGHLTNEFELERPSPKIKKFLVSLAEKYNANFNAGKKRKLYPSTDKVMLARMWVNFQKKHEFSPMHLHSGKYSFVIWLKIPYDIGEEKKRFKRVTGGPKNSAFVFYYTNALGQICSHNILVDKSMEGYICFFPAEMTHSVNPFYTSDEFRISVAGNLIGV